MDLTPKTYKVELTRKGNNLEAEERWRIPDIGIRLDMPPRPMRRPCGHQSLFFLEDVAAGGWDLVHNILGNGLVKAMYKASCGFW